MAEHSAEPWRVEDGIGLEDGEICLTRIWSIKVGKDRWLTDLVASDSRQLQERGWFPVAEQKANAHLIVAAPALLAALRETSAELLAAFGSVSDPDNPRGWSDEDAFRTYQQAQAAIRKAEGKIT
jgi:hypothetical protein